MERVDIVRKLSAASGLTNERCHEIMDHVYNAFATCVKSSPHLNIEDFGVFRRYNPGPNMPARLYFTPSKTLIDRCSAAPVAAEPVNEPMQPVLPKQRLPQVRPEDAEIISLWIQNRQGLRESRITEELIFDENPKSRLHFISPLTVRTARKSVEKFARHTSVPLLEIGLKQDSSGIYEREDLRKEILNYAAFYQSKILPRLVAKMHEKDNRNPVPLVFRTQGWFQFVKYTKDFYNWCIEEGYRPKGSNPFHGIKNVSAVYNGKILIHREWYKEVLRYPRMKPRERAILYLLATGLRASECCTSKLENLDLRTNTLLVVGKGRKVRVVKLPWWTIQALRAYLETRRNNANPYIFPNYFIPNEPTTYEHIKRIVNRAAAKAFPRYEDLHKRKSIKPHGFRRFYATQRLDHGGNIMVTMDQTGHASLEMYKKYVTVDDNIRDKDHNKVTRTRWW